MVKLPSISKLTGTVTRIVITVVVVAIVATGAYFVFFKPSPKTTVTARFAAATGIYEATPVRILGVNVGEVTKVKPGPRWVDVTIQYDSKYRIRAKDAKAIEVANSLVSDRYINLSTLIAKNDSSPALRNGSIISVDNTGGPAELDEIYDQLDRLSTALGPQGANAGGKQNGALSNLLKVSAANLQGNGAALGRSISNVAAAARTLSDKRGGLFGTVRNLQKLTTTLKDSDTQVRSFNTLLAKVAGQLSDERGDLGAALKLLGLALNDVSSFIKDNAAKFHTDIGGLRSITSLLVRQKASLQETLAVAPIALANIVHAYNPNQGSLGTRSNLVSFTNLDLTGAAKNVICGVLGQVTDVPALGDIIKSTCTTKTSSSAGATKTTSASKATPLTAEQAGNSANIVNTMLNGGVPVGTLVGSGS